MAVVQFPSTFSLHFQSEINHKFSPLDKPSPHTMRVQPSPRRLDSRHGAGGGAWSTAKCCRPSAANPQGAGSAACGPSPPSTQSATGGPWSSGSRRCCPSPWWRCRQSRTLEGCRQRRRRQPACCPSAMPSNGHHSWSARTYLDDICLPLLAVFDALFTQPPYFAYPCPCFSAADGCSHRPNND